MAREIGNTQIAGRFILAFVIMAAAFFGSSGNVLWPEAWLFILLYLAYALVLTIWLKRNDPALLQSRLRLFSASMPGWDRKVMILFVLLAACLLTLPGLDAVRFGWSVLPRGLKMAGLLLMVGGLWTIFAVFRHNSYASPYVEVQHHRSHRVIDSGPYARVRHPMYSGMILFLIGFPLWMGSLWTLLPAMAITVVIVYRIGREEILLCDELDDYRDYMKRVRFRLIPGLW